MEQRPPPPRSAIPPLPPPLPVAPPVQRQYVPCPRCQSEEVSRVAFSWWGGLVGPAMFNHCKCARCAATFNGKTGASNTTAIAVYVIVTMIVVLAAAGLVFLYLPSLL